MCIPCSIRLLIGPLTGLLLLFATLWSAAGLADALSEPPARWASRLKPVAETDISGAEPLMRQALREARAEVERLLEAPTTSAEALGRAYGRLGARLLLLEVETQADACLKNAMRLDPEELRWPYYAGYMAMLAGNLERALGYLRRAARIDAEYPPLALRLGKVQLDRGDLPAARVAFEQVADEPRLGSPARYYLGQIALLERRYEEARDHLQAALDANPAATEVHYPLARAYQGLGQEAAAKAQMERFVLRSPEIADPLLDELKATTQHALPAFERAMHAVRHADYAAAVEAFATGLAIDPGNAAARVSYARVLYLHGQQAEAEQQLKQVLAKPADSTAAPASGRASGQTPSSQMSGQGSDQMSGQGSDQMSDQGSDQMLDQGSGQASVQPSGRISSRALAHFFLGVLLQARGAEGQAGEAYRATLALAPEHAGARFQLANLDFAAKRYADAAAGYRAVFATDPNAAPARLLQLIAEARAGTDARDIATRLAAVRKVAPNDDQLTYAAGRLLAAAMDPEVQDSSAALKIAAELVATAPIPPHRRLLALADAAAGRTQRAAEAQAALIVSMGWMVPPAERRLMLREQEAFLAGELPRPAWPEGDPLLSPPPFDARRLFRDYPATMPF